MRDRFSSERCFLQQLPDFDDIAPATGAWQPWAQGMALAVVYFIAAGLGLSFATVTSNITLLWPPTGIALFALLTFGVRLWPAVLVGALAANLATPVAPGVALGIAVGNCLEAVTGYYLLRAAGFEASLARVRDVVALIVLAAGLSTMVSATIGTLSLVAFGAMPWPDLGRAWFTWWMGDAMGNLVFAATLLAWWHGPAGRIGPRRMIEAVVLTVSLAVVTHLIFGVLLSDGASPRPLAFMTFPLLTWAALRFGMRGATGATLVVGIVTLANIMAGHGLFARSSAVESLTLLWLYVNVLAVTGMALAASVAERVKAESRMRHLAEHDALTGLPNRLTARGKIVNAVQRANLGGGRFAVLFTDIDRFKVINDTLGHSAGDELLRQIAARLRRTLRHSDLLSRHGGDEFVVLAEGINSGDDAGRVARKLLDALREPFVIETMPLHVSGSVGISLYPDDGRDADALLKNADIAMYRAKDSGRNTCVFYSPDMNARAAERLAMENELRQALDRGEFRLHYQPQYAALGGRPVAVEALLRWQRADGRLIPPANFIPLLEDTGLINRVGAWVLDAACEQLAEWRARGAAPLRMAVNVSSHQLRDAALPGQVVDALARRGLAPEWLELEITETMLVSQDAVVERNLLRLAEVGVRVAVDDFGTGYSSLNYLHRMSINTLKIDRSFVANLPGDENGAAITRAIVALGKSLRLDIVAEGVETSAQRDYLRELGCDCLQGFLLSRPLPADDITPLLVALPRVVSAD